MNDDQENIDYGEDEGGGWMVSYADMMTLIACFFILMMAFANYDPAGFNRKVTKFSKSFGKGKHQTSEIKMDQMTSEIARHPNLKKKTKITQTDSEIIISMASSVLFEEGSYKLTNSILPDLDVLVDIIRTRNPNYKVVVEGHSDPFEYKKNKTMESSWELSGLRAARVLQRFEFFGFDPQKIVAISKGDSEPIADNVNERGEPIKKNNIANRRVLIKVMEPKEASKNVKFGFGVYFND